MSGRRKTLILHDAVERAYDQKLRLVDRLLGEVAELDSAHARSTAKLRERLNDASAVAAALAQEIGEDRVKLIRERP